MGPKLLQNRKNRHNFANFFLPGFEIRGKIVLSNVVRYPSKIRLTKSLQKIIKKINRHHFYPTKAEFPEVTDEKSKYM